MLPHMSTLSDLKGIRWAGASELWLDPLGNDVIRGECTMSVDDRGLRYTWTHEGKTHEGSITLEGEGATFTDTWHQPERMTCRRLSSSWGLFQVEGTYGPESDWGWRMGLSLRTPTGELVLQMTNIAPWGEEARAVRMVGARQG